MGSRLVGIAIAQGSTVIGNTSMHQTGNPGIGDDRGLPSNVTDNTIVNNGLPNLQLNGTGCNVTNNVAP